MKKFLASILAITVLVLMAFCGCAKDDETNVFVKPENYVSVVQIKINPTVNLYFDEADIILAVEYVNEDAKDCYSKVEKQLVGKELKNGVNLVVETAADEGYFDYNKTVTVDIVEAKQEDKKISVLTAATDVIETTITEKKLGAEVKLSESAQKLIDDKAAADKAAADKAAADKAAADKAAADKAAADKAAADKAAADKAAAEKELKNPQKNLKKNTEYRILKPDETGEMLTGIHMRFKDNGEYSYTQVPYTADEFGEGEYVIYNGKKYFVAGGGGGGGRYTTTTERIILTDAFEMELSLTADGKLVVEKLNGQDDFFVVGDIISVP